MIFHVTVYLLHMSLVTSMRSISAIVVAKAAKQLTSADLRALASKMEAADTDN